MSGLPMLGLSSDIVLGLLGVVPPALLAALLLVVAWRPWQSPKIQSGGGWAAGLALALGLASAFAGIRGWGFLTPVSGQDWLPWAGVAAVAAVVVASAARGGRSAVLLRASLACGVAWATLSVHWARRWEHGAEGLLHIGGAALLLYLMITLMAPLAERRSGALLPTLWCSVASVAGFVLFSACHSSFLGQLSGALASVLGVAVGVAMWNRNLSLGGEGGTVFATLLGALLLNGGYSMITDPDGPPLASLGMVILAVLAPWLTSLPALAQRSPLVRVGVSLVAVAVPLGLAVWCAWPEPDPYGY